MVDDDDDIRSALAEYLSQEGFDVAVASDGAAALALLRGSDLPDVVLLDLMMPTMDGWEFRVAQKRDPLLAQIPVIALSANQSSQARAVDADAFVPKPFDFSVLVSTIDKLVARAWAERRANADRLAALGTLTAGIAHEINNPLCYVIANLQLGLERLRVSPDPKVDLPPLMEEALEGARRIASIVREVQQVSRPSPHEPSILDPRGVTEAALRLTSHQILPRARLETDFRQAPAVQIDRVRLEQVLVNLIVNAVHSIAEGRALENTIRVSVGTAADGGAEIRVADSGSGIPDAAKPRIFDPFFTTKAGTGTGLGLPISRAIVTAAGGEIRFESLEGKGTIFSVRLPAAHLTRIEQVRGSASMKLPRLSILAVDDEQAILRSLKGLLAPSHELVLASAPSEALKIVRDRSFDVVLCDITMPEMPGAELADRIAAVAPTLGDRIVFMTGGAFTPRSQALVNTSNRPLLEKPFSEQALQAVLLEVSQFRR